METKNTFQGFQRPFFAFWGDLYSQELIQGAS